MNEKWALDAIAKREYIQKDKVFDIVKVTPKHCDGCYFEHYSKCPHAICNSKNGGILVLNNEKTERLRNKTITDTFCL